MTERRSHAPGFFTMGAPLLLTVLLVLMLVTFSLLSLSSAREERQRSRLLASRTDAYYAACNQAQTVIDHLSNSEDPGLPIDETGDTLRFSVPITDTQSLTVALRKEAGGYTVTAWTVENN